jgi:CMP-N-acetylneuraminic acid synthetase
MRPAELAQDLSSGFDATIHTLDWLREHGGEPDYVFILQPTSPLRTSADIRAAIDLGLSRKADAVIGVTEASPHPYLARTMSTDGTLGYLIEVSPKPTSRHEYPAAWLINGAIYLTSVDSLRRTKTFQPPGTLGFVMPIERSMDIDSPWELHLADLILRAQGHGS